MVVAGMVSFVRSENAFLSELILGHRGFNVAQMCDAGTTVDGVVRTLPLSSGTAFTRKPPRVSVKTEEVTQILKNFFLDVVCATPIG